MKNLLTKCKNALNFLFLTHIGRIITLILLAPTFNYISNEVASDSVSVFFYYAAMVCFGLLLVYGLVFIAFAWVINPIREYRNNKKK